MVQKRFSYFPYYQDVFNSEVYARGELIALVTKSVGPAM